MRRSNSTERGLNQTCVPGASQHDSDAMQNRNRYGSWRSRISGAPFASAHAAPHPGHSYTGTRTVARNPPIGLSPSVMSPPCERAMSRAIASPSPVPPSS
jgi:hypothetical protein